MAGLIQYCSASASAALAIDRLGDCQNLVVLDGHQLGAELSSDLLGRAGGLGAARSVHGQDARLLHQRRHPQQADRFVEFIPVGGGEQQDFPVLPLLVPHPPVAAERLEEGDGGLVEPEAEFFERGVVSAVPGEPDQQQAVGRRCPGGDLSHVRGRDGLSADEGHIAELLLEVAEVAVHLRDLLRAPGQVLNAAAGSWHWWSPRTGRCRA